MKILRILFWTLVSLAACSGLVRADSKTLELPVRVEGAAGTVIVEDDSGKEIERVRVEAGQEHVFQLKTTPLAERRYRIRQVGYAAKVQYDTRVYDVTVCSYLDDEEEEICVAVISCGGKKVEKIAFHNQTKDTPIPETGDRSRTWMYLIMMAFSACGFWIAVARRRRLR